ncbi:MAG: HlyD family type I secretion periplasmic adaptor subunit [Pseudomonadota bacterium]
MFGDQTEDHFANDIASGTVAARGTSFWPILLILLGAIGLFVAWAWYSELEQVTSGEGRVIPSGQTQVIQTLEGGLVSHIYVQEGEIVEKDQALVQIDDTSFSSKLGELQQQEAALIAERFRLLAEAELQENFRIPELFRSKHASTSIAEEQVFSSRRNQLINELEVLDSRLTQKNFELRELQAQENKLVSTLAPLQKEAELTEKMVQSGVIPEVEYLRLESRLAELQGDLDVNRASQPRIQASIEEAGKLTKTTKNNYSLTARERLAKLEAELSIIQETMKAATDRVTRAELKAPVKGIVNKINVTTIGSVVQPGRDIMEIVPVDDGLMIEARIRPQDVAFIKPDEQASVKLTAYDYLIYGDLKGRVVRIGADTIADQDGEEFYQVIIRTDKNHIGKMENKFPIIPGMVATVDIKTGKNTVLSYLLKPVLRAKTESLRER